MINLTIYEAPPSINHMYGQTKTGRRFLSKKGKDYKESVKSIVGDVNILDGEIEMTIIYYFGDNRRRDVTNYDKALLDSLSGVVYNDDCQIQKITLEKFIDKENPRTEVAINQRS